MLQKLKTVIPAYAGIQLSKRGEDNSPRLLKTFVKWIPAFARLAEAPAKRAGMTLIVLLFALTFTLSASPAYADPAPSPTPCVDDDSITKGFGPCPAGLKEIEEMAGNVISVIVYLGFMVMLVLIIWTGIKYLTSGGEPKAIQATHQTLTWALLGVVFLAIAWLILQLIAGFTGIQTLTIFNIKTLCRVIGGDPLQFCK